MSTIHPPRLGLTFPSLAAFKQAQDAWWRGEGGALYNVWYDVVNDYEITDFIAYCRTCQHSVWARGGACDDPD